MTLQTEKTLFSIVSSYGVHAIISDDKKSVVINCRLEGKPLPVNVYFEDGNFQINAADIVTIDKIENQQLSIEDIKELLGNFVDSLARERIVVFEHTAFGKKAYSLLFTSDRGHEVVHHQYESILEALVKKLGKSRKIGTLSPMA